jgi:hypothetical protein
MKEKSVIVFLIVILIGVVVFLGGCNPASPGSNTDVYIGGAFYTTAGSLPCYWKNEGLFYLPVPDYLQAQGLVNSIDISGIDIYMAGWVTNGQGASYPTIPAVWINGNLIVLNVLDNTKNAEARSVAVNNGNVTVAGYCRNSSDIDVPCIWQDMNTKNPTTLPIPVTATYGYAQSAKVSNGIVYVAGYTQQSGPGLRTPCLWQIGSGRTDFTGYDVGKDSYINSLFILGTTRYLGGVSKNGSDVSMPGYWKDEVWQTPTLPVVNDTLGGTVFAIFADASNVYAAGFVNTGQYIPSYWLNGTQTSMDMGTHVFGVAQAIYVSGADVYIAGYLDLASLPCYWKSGTLHMLMTSKNLVSKTNAIYVVQH